MPSFCFSPPDRFSHGIGGGAAKNDIKGIEGDFSLEIDANNTFASHLFAKISPLYVSNGTFSGSWKGEDLYLLNAKLSEAEWINIDGTYDKKTGVLIGNVSLKTGDQFYSATHKKSPFFAIILKDQKEFVMAYDNGKTGFPPGTVERKESIKGEVKVTTEPTNVNFPVRAVYQEDEKKEEPVEEPVKQPDSGARFSGLNGQVEWRPDDCGRTRPDDCWHLVDMDTVLPVMAHIRTQEDSSAVIGFSDMSTYVLKPESEVVITTPPAKDSKMKLVLGNVWANIKKTIKDGTMEIEMNQAVAGIKGTTLVASEINGVSSLKVIEGTVTFTAKSDGKTVDVEGGSMASASSAGLSNVETFNVPQETADWDVIEKNTIGSEGKSKRFPMVYILAGLVALAALAVGIKFLIKKRA